MMTLEKFTQMLIALQASDREKRWLMEYCISTVDEMRALGFKSSSIRAAFKNAGVVFTESAFSTELCRARKAFRELPGKARAEKTLEHLYAQLKVPGTVEALPSIKAISGPQPTGSVTEPVSSNTEDKGKLAYEKLTKPFSLG